MSYQEDFFILGQPVETRIGDCHFLKVKDYPKLSIDLQIVSMTKTHFIHAFRSEDKNDEENKRLIEHLEELSLLQIIVNYLDDVLESYIRVFNHFFNYEGALNRVESEEEFESLRQLILKLSCIKEEKINPNPEIQAAIERSRQAKSINSENITFTTIASSVSSLSGKSYLEINEMTLYQLYLDFYRLMYKFSYDTTTLFATVGEIDVESWSKEIDIFEDEKHAIEMSKLNSIAKQIE